MGMVRDRMVGGLTIGVIRVTDYSMPTQITDSFKGTPPTYAIPLLPNGQMLPGGSRSHTTVYVLSLHLMPESIHSPYYLEFGHTIVVHLNNPVLYLVCPFLE